MSPELTTFLWGAGASLAVEIVDVNRTLAAGRSPLPARYRSWVFWVFRVLLAIVGGGLALAHGIKGSPWLAAHIGIATPLIFDRIGRGLPASPEGALPDA